MPCEILTIDAQDVLGSHEVDIHEHMAKVRLDELGQIIPENSGITPVGTNSASSVRHYTYSPTDLQKIKHMVDKHEGCQITGRALVNKVPGNMHISTHAHAHLLGDLYESWRFIDIGHVIQHFSFGRDDDVNYVKNNFPDTGIVAPLDGVDKVTHDHTIAADPIIFEYYLKVVPTTYRSPPRMLGNTHVYQFTAHSAAVTNPQMPAIYFRYDISPVTVLFEEREQSLLTFVLHVCAILGGVFTVAGMVDALLHRSVYALYLKYTLNKLG
eukprot:Platyproteum_vivax@DN5855_c0_g1_i1.p1